MTDPGRLVARLTDLRLKIDGGSTATGSVPVEGYYGGAPRPTGRLLLSGLGATGEGENVDWTPAEQAAFARSAEAALEPYDGMLGDWIRTRAARLGSPHHRAAAEAAAIDLALRQAATDPFALVGAVPAPVQFCWSLGREAIAAAGGPLAAVERVLAAEPGAAFKLDGPEGEWPEGTWRALAATGRVVVVDFKGSGGIDAVRAARRWLPEAWLEDPPPAGTDEAAAGGRLALDRLVLAPRDVDRHAGLAAVNVKAPRMGGVLAALRALARCRERGLAAYVGGMFEIGPGRRQARVLASLFTAEAWNDLAPTRDRGDPWPPSPLAVEPAGSGFATG